MDRKPVGVTAPYRAMTAEDEEFNRIEMESRIKQEYVRDLNKKPNITQIMEELAWARLVIRELSDRLAKLEAKQ